MSSVSNSSRPEATSKRSWSKRAGAAVLIGLASLGMGLTAAPAEAATVRPGAKAGQVDILLDSYETEAVRRDYWAATVVCWNSGLAGKVAFVPCTTMITVCAARAYYESPRRRAGITFTAWGDAWCWKY